MGHRPSATPPMRVRFPRALKEFIAVPLLVILGLLALAVVSMLGDQSHGRFFTGGRKALAMSSARRAPPTR